MGLDGDEFRRVGVRERGDRIGRWSREVVGWLPALRARRWARRELMKGTAVSSLMGELPFKVGLRESSGLVMFSPG